MSSVSDPHHYIHDSVRCLLTKLDALYGLYGANDRDCLLSSSLNFSTTSQSVCSRVAA